MEYSLLIPWQGIAMHDVGMTLNRLAVGIFFAISGYHKLFNPARNASLVATLEEDHIPLLRFNQWFVPNVELCAGLALAVGFLSVWAALLLGAVCLVATCTDGIKRIASYKPLDKADWLDDMLYLPEVLYGLMLIIVICSGPGAYSLDAVLWR